MRFYRLAAALALAVSGAAAPAETPPIYIQAGRLLADPARGRVETAMTIVVQDGRVAEIRRGYFGNGRVVDLRDAFVLPGLIDSHVHLTGESGPTEQLDAVTKSSADLALDGAMFARRTLRAGFTTVADLGADPEAIHALRDAIAAGKIEGPRIIAAGFVAAHGGHGDIHGYRADVMTLLSPATLCSGADDCMRAVRLAVRDGADIIKTASTGGVLSDTDAGVGQQMTDAELDAIVQTAHRLGRRVAAHAHGADGINAALRAGVDSIEHGSYLDANSIRMMKAQGTYLVPTLLAAQTVQVQAETATWMPDAVKEKARKVGALTIGAARRAHESGVRIAFGTDSGVSRHGDNALEFALLVKAGLSPIEAIRAATVGAAAHLGIDAEAGTIAVGRPADMVAVRGDPLTDITVLESVAFVMRNGVVVRSADDH